MKTHPSEFTSWLPEYPRTLHLPHNPNAARNDLIASNKDVAEIFSSDNVYIEEKIDGANCGMMLIDDGKGESIPLIRNRSHILSKGYNKGTPAKQQFSSVWNWFYVNKNKFQTLNDYLGYQAGVYGEWLFALHGIKYDKLPSLFVPFDIYDYANEHFLDTGVARDALVKAGFDIVPLLRKGPIKNYEELEQLCQEQSPFASERREGLYIKVTDGTKITNRFKMVRKDFIQGCHWSDKYITKNSLK